MTTAEVKELVSPEFVRELFEDSIVDASSPRWAITVCGKIITVGGKMFYDSREQAVRGFYNSFSWRARRSLYMKTHPGDSPWGYWGSPDRSTMWKGFKEALIEKFGFNIIQV